MAWGTLTIGSLVLKETDILEDVTNANTGVRSVRIQGAETNPGRVPDEQFIEAVQQDIMGLLDRIMPVTFERKDSYDGYYRFTDTNTTYEKWAEGPGQVRWSLSMDYLGPDNAVDLESRVSNVVRLNDFGFAGERWHAPPIGHYGYYVGAVSPAVVTRQTETGPITVYRAIPAGINPRYGATVAAYQAGRVRMLAGGLERVGERFPCPVSDWEMNNGLVRVRPNPDNDWFTTLLLAFWDGAAWQEKKWDVRIAGDSLRPGVDFRSVVVTRNDNECVVVRIVYAQPSNGARGLLDLTLRRGSRFVEGYVQRATSGQISVQLDSLEEWTDNVNHVIAKGADVNGLRYVAGRSRNFDPATNGGVSDSNTAAMDFFVGVEVPGTEVGLDPGTFETGVGTWAATGGTFTQVNDQVKQGSFSGKLVVAGAPALAYVRNYAQPAPVVAGQKYRVSFWARSLDGADVSAAVDWQDSGGTYISTDAGTTTLLPNVWTFLEYETPAAPAGSLTAAYGPTLNGNPPTGETLWVDQVKLRRATDTGDKAATLVQQYMGTMAEKVGVVRR